jgi:hypothetical protein
MHLKVFLKLKNPNNSLFWANLKNKQKTHWASFFLNPGFSNPGLSRAASPGTRTARSGSGTSAQMPAPCRANVLTSLSAASTCRRADSLWWQPRERERYRLAQRSTVGCYRMLQKIRTCLVLQPVSQFTPLPLKVLFCRKSLPLPLPGWGDNSY